MKPGHSPKSFQSGRWPLTWAQTWYLIEPSAKTDQTEDTMNIRAISALQASRPTAVHDPGDNSAAFRQLRPTMSRRQFARAAATTAVVGSTLGSRLWKPGLAEASASFAPVHIPGGSPVLGGYHVFGPAAFDPIDAEPATITNHNGSVGLAYISGMVTQTNTQTGEQQRLPFIDSDMRFMDGVFRGMDGRIHQGAFAFV